jgi:hypothetical protein
MSKRVNKNKKDIASDMMLARDAERRRSLIKDTIFPYLVEMNEHIAYSKVFLQSFAGLVEGVFDDTRKTITIGDIKEALMLKLSTLFTLSNEDQKKEYDRYVALIERLNDTSIQDLAYASELPRYIDGYTSKSVGKNPISSVDINEILG